MLYSDFLKMDRQFEAAVNLGLDLNKYKKIEEYIPTDSSVKVLKQYLTSIEDEKSERATVLIGPYGKGKSHLLLILCALVGMPLDNEENVQVLNRLIDNIEKQDVEVAVLARSIILNEKRLMPVIINGGYGDLQQTFLVALKEALERENIEGITPHTYYEVAINTIKKWEKEYPVTLQAFKAELSEKKYNLTELIDLLGNYDKKAYDTFCNIHPKVCSGSIFNPMINMNIVNMYKAVNEELHKTYGYSGMLVIFDEFSKFLENTKVQSSGELKILQDFAEMANRQANQIYLTCITHKPIGNYTKDLSKERALAYRAVEGRFKEIYFVSSAEQNYELIKNSIQRDDIKFAQYKKENKDFFNQLKDDVTSLGVFPQGMNVLDEIVEGCFPLHPMTTFMSIRISELVAQNERTLFTFLASHQKHTLRHFIEHNKVKNKTLTMDRLYDYFKDGFKKEMSNEVIATAFSQTENLLKKKMTKVQTKILKAMALINMVNQPVLIQATKKVLLVAVAENEDVFEQEMNDLIRQHHVFKRNSDGVYICLNTSNVDIRNRINEYKQLKVRNINRREVLSQIYDLGYTLPKQFNDDYQMIRFFKNEFITFNELNALNNAKEILSEKKSDGVVWHLIYDETDDLAVVCEKLKQLGDERFIVCIPEEAFAIEEYLKEYMAIELLKNDKNLIENDLPVLEELSLYQQDTMEAICNYIHKYFSVENEENKWVTLKEEKQVNSKKALSAIVSAICKDVYWKTPIVASELINKQNISGPILTARNKVINNIIEGNELVTKGNSPDITITRATITNKGVLEEDVDDLGLAEALIEIEKFIKQADGKIQNFGDLYEVLQSAPYGMRRGIIPIYIALYLKKYSNDIVIYSGIREVDLNVETLKYMDREPSKYNLILERGTSDKVEYIERMSKIFEINGGANNFHAQCTGIVEGMRNWFRGLPKCSRELQGDVYISEFRKQIIKMDINPREFLLDIVPNKVCQTQDFSECATLIKNIKATYDNNFEQLLLNLIQDTKEIFMPGYTGELSGALRAWYATLDSNLNQYMLDTQASRVIDLITNIDDFNEKRILERLGVEIIGLHLEDWTNHTSNEFIKQLQHIKEDISNVKVVDEEVSEGTKISIHLNGVTKQKLLREEEISPIGETLLSNLKDSLDEYGDAIEASEKMNILIQLINTLM